MNRSIPFSVVFACLLFVSAGSASSQDLALDFPIESYTLDNGLRVVLSPGDRSPTVAVAVYYDVGSRNEEQGRSGFAHLFEHMMFQGSENIGKGEHFQHISGNGGRMNGTTSEDRTNYYEILPSDRLALGLWLESDRMRALSITAENFENQREVVKEERRMRVDNQPYVPAYLAFQEMFYENWAYGHSVIGSMDDLDAAELADVQAFFDLYYAPNNAVLTIVGQFESAEARVLVEQYFGDIPRGAEPPVVDATEPPQQAPREESVTDALATQPMAIVAWHSPSAPNAEHDIMNVLSEILTGGESARLYRRLIRNDEIALDVSSATDGKRGPDMFWIEATTRDVDPTVARDAILEEVALVVSNGVTPEEVAAAQQRMVSDVVFGLEGNLRVAQVIGRDTLYYGEPDRLNGSIDRILAVTAEDIHRVAAAYLTQNNLNMMLIRPESDDAAIDEGGAE